MTDSKKNINRTGERKKTSARRSSSRKKERQKDARWLHILVATLITPIMLFLAYHLVFKKNIFRFDVREGVKAYAVYVPEGHTTLGLDISHHQGEINWKKLKEGQTANTPIRFVYIKATEGRDHKDPRYNKNWKEAKRHGFIRGAYHYFTTASSGDAQANMFIKNVRLDKGDLPPMVDIEETPADKEKFITELKKFILRLEEYYGVKPLIYSYPKYNLKYLTDPFFKDYELWIAHYYVDKPRSNRPWTIWQFTDKGIAPGIRQKVDINVIMGGEEKLRELQIE